MKSVFLLPLFILTKPITSFVNNCETGKIYGRWAFLTNYEGRLTSIDTLTLRNASVAALTYKKTGRFEHSEGVRGKFRIDNKNCHLKEFIDTDTFEMEITYLDDQYLLLYDVSAKERNKTFIYKKL